MEPVSRRGLDGRSDRCDVVVVGAGLAGSAAATTLAAAGLDVLLFDRGARTAGAGTLTMSVLAEVLGDRAAAAPTERRIVEERRWFLSAAGTTSLAPASPPLRCSIAHGDFERWFAAEAVEAGARLRTGAVVERLLVESGRVAGVVVDGEQVAAETVVLCDGLGLGSSLLQRAHLRPPVRSDAVALAVSEVLAIPADAIGSRFGVEGDEGVVIRCFGGASLDLPGFMSIVTNATSVAVGGGIVLSELVATGIKPGDLLAQFKRHPEVRPLLAGGEVVATAARLVPLPPAHAGAHTHGPGYLVCGDAALRAAAAYRGGCDFAVTSGRLAGETLVSLRERGLSTTEQSLREYAMRLDHAHAEADRLDRVLDGFLVPGRGAEAARRALAVNSDGVNGDRPGLRSLARKLASRR